MRQCGAPAPLTRPASSSTQATRTAPARLRAGPRNCSAASVPRAPGPTALRLARSSPSTRQGYRAVPSKTRAADRSSGWAATRSSWHRHIGRRRTSSRGRNRRCGTGWRAATRQISAVVRASRPAPCPRMFPTRACLRAAVGTSNFGPRQLRRVNEYWAGRGVPHAVNQVQFSLLSTLPLENGLFDACAELGVTPIGYSPLGVPPQPHALSAPPPALPPALCTTIGQTQNAPERPCTSLRLPRSTWAAERPLRRAQSAPRAARAALQADLARSHAAAGHAA